MNDENELSIINTESNECTLSPARQRILQALLNPAFAGVNVTEKCNHPDVNVSRKTWYEAKRDPAFMEIVNKMQYDMLKDGVTPAMAALIKSASNPSPKSNPDRRLLFELTGHSVKEFNGQNVVIVKVDG